MPSLLINPHRTHGRSCGANAVFSVSQFFPQQPRTKYHWCNPARKDDVRHDAKYPDRVGKIEMALPKNTEAHPVDVDGYLAPSGLARTAPLIYTCSLP